MAATQSKCVRSVATKASRYRSVVLPQRVESTPPPDTQKHRRPCNVLLLLCNVKVASLGWFAFTCAKNAAVVFAVRAAESLPVRHRNMVWSWTSTASSINAAFGPVRSRKHAVLSASPPCCPVERLALTANEGRRATADSSGGVGVFKGVSGYIIYIWVISSTPRLQRRGGQRSYVNSKFLLSPLRDIRELHFPACIWPFWILGEG